MRNRGSCAPTDSLRLDGPRVELVLILYRVSFKATDNMSLIGLFCALVTVTVLAPAVPDKLLIEVPASAFTKSMTSSMMYSTFV